MQRKLTLIHTFLPVTFKFLTYDIKGGSICLYTRELARSAIVDGIGGNEIRQQSGMATLHAAKRCVLKSGPGTVNDSHTMFHH